MSLFPVTRKYFRLILYFLCLNSRNSHFSKELWFLLLENGIKNQYPADGCVCCYQCTIASKCSVDKTRKMSVHQPVFICISMYKHIIFPYVTICIYCERNIKMESILLGDLSKIKLRSVGKF